MKNSSCLTDLVDAGTIVMGSVIGLAYTAVTSIAAIPFYYALKCTYTGPGIKKR